MFLILLLDIINIGKNSNQLLSPSLRTSLSLERKESALTSVSVSDLVSNSELYLDSARNSIETLPLPVPSDNKINQNQIKDRTSNNSIIENKGKKQNKNI